MENQTNKESRCGRYVPSTLVGSEQYFAYVPSSLPPDPPLDMTRLSPLVEKAASALSHLGGKSSLIPDTQLFLYMYVRKEAVLSSQIEGTQSSLSDLLLYESKEAPGAPIDDVAEVSCYVSALNYGIERLEELPLSLRLIREMHERLMNNARGGDKSPGEFRYTQNWIGGTRPGNASFVPPPPNELMPCLNKFEKFLHDDSVKYPALVVAALAHHQFETIHPFLDGNGRLGRLLIPIILHVRGLIPEPILYLSLYFKTHKKLYYDLLQSVRETGNWEDWIEFFLEGVIETSQQAAEAAQNIVELFIRDRKKIEQSNRPTASALTICTLTQQNPILNTSKICKTTGMSLPTAIRGLKLLENLGIMTEITGKSRHKVYIYQEYLNLLNDGTEFSY